MNQKRPCVALISGASSGIGREFACELARQHAQLHEGHRLHYRGSQRQKELMRSMVAGLTELWLLARRSDKLEELRQELSQINPHLQYHLISCDLSNELELEKLSQELKQKNPRLHFLVNAAGWGFLQRVALSDRVSLQSMLKVNCMATLELCYQALPYAVRGCKIINISSAVAFLPLIGSAVYAASKSFVLNFSRALNHELKDVGINVLAVCPKAVSTEFWNHVGKGSHMQQSVQYFGVETPHEVVIKALADAVREKDISISSIQAKALYLGVRFAPSSLIFYLEDKLGMA